MLNSWVDRVPQSGTVQVNVSCNRGFTDSSDDVDADDGGIVGASLPLPRETLVRRERTFFTGKLDVRTLDAIVICCSQHVRSDACHHLRCKSRTAATITSVQAREPRRATPLADST